MRYFMSNALLPLKYISCGNLISKQEFIHSKRNIDSNVFIMVKEGTLYISQYGIKYEVGSNQYIFLRAGEEHYGYKASPGKLSYLWVHFSFAGKVSVLNKAFLPELTENKNETSHNDNYIIPEYGNITLTKRAPLLFNQLLDLSRQEMIYSVHMINYALSLLIMEITQEFIERQNNIKNKITPVVALIMEWIKANYDRVITVSEIAGEFGYNPDYLSSLFVKTTGISLINYINKTRIEISKSLLSSYDVSIKEAAYSCGFSDEKYYMKVFKKFEGMTPSQYKKAFTRKRIN